MEHHVTVSIEYMMKSMHELARILEAERHATEHVSRVVSVIPSRPLSFGEGEAALLLALDVKEDVGAYLSSIGDLQEAIGDNLQVIMAEINTAEGYE